MFNQVLCAPCLAYSQPEMSPLKNEQFLTVFVVVVVSAPFSH